MGMFDTVEVPCPECGRIYLAQSKGGSCGLYTYSFNECPQDVLSDINRHAPFECDNCNATFEIELKPTVIRKRY